MEHTQIRRRAAPSFLLGIALLILSTRTLSAESADGADEEVGAPGWEIDDISVSGTTNTPFTALVPEMTVCTAGH